MAESLGITVVLADNHAIVREGFAALCAANGMTILGQASDGPSALLMISNLKPDFAILDLHVPGMTGAEVIRRLRAAGITTKLMILTISREDSTVADALRAGADAYLLKDGPARHLLDAIHSVQGGGVYVSPLLRGAGLFTRAEKGPADGPMASLSKRETEVLSYLVKGLRANDIAERLGISPKTVDTYRASLMRKLNVHDLVGLVKFAIERDGGDDGMADAIGVPVVRPPRLPHRPPRGACAELPIDSSEKVQEQLFRTEKLAAVGRLISGVMTELQTPLKNINELASRALERENLGAAERDVAAIAAEAQKASGMVARLVSFAAAEQPVARPVSVSALLRSMLEFREGDWKASGIRLHETISREPLNVLGSQSQLEQVFLNLLVHVEQALADSPRKTVAVRTNPLGKRLLIEISFSAPPEPHQPEENAAILGVTRSVVAGHGGEIRLIEKANAEPRFEVELPLAPKERVGAAPQQASVPIEAGRRMTALVIEPDEVTQKQLRDLLSARGYRQVVPVSNADAGLDLAQRMRFDAAFCSVHAPGLNWVELSERMHSRVGGFILLSESYDAELVANFEGDGRYVLSKPVQDGELDRVLRGIENVAQTHPPLPPCVAMPAPRGWPPPVWAVAGRKPSVAS